MGVKGLWKVLNTVSRNVPLESLEGKVLAIDVSIWLNQALKAANESSNAHLLVLFHRICKLLFCKIKPIFVFDGRMPALKRLALEKRRLQRNLMQDKISKTRKEYLLRYIKKQAVAVHLLRDKVNERDLIYTQVADDSSNSQQPQLAPPLVDEISEEEEGVDYIDNYLPQDDDATRADWDLDSEAFHCLPKEVQHEIIRDKIQAKKSHHNFGRHNFPTNDEDFSRFQFTRLLEKSHLSNRLDQVRREMVHRDLTDATRDVQLPEHLSQHQNEILGNVMARRVVGEAAGHVILWKFPTQQSASSSATADVNDVEQRADISTESTTSVVHQLAAEEEDEDSQDMVIIEKAEDYANLEAKVQWAPATFEGSDEEEMKDSQSQTNDTALGLSTQEDLLESVQQISKRLLQSRELVVTAVDSSSLPLTNSLEEEEESFSTNAILPMLGCATESSSVSLATTVPIASHRSPFQSPLPSTMETTFISESSADEDWETVPDVCEITPPPPHLAAVNGFPSSSTQEESAPTDIISPPPPPASFEPGEIKRIQENANEWREENEQAMQLLREREQQLERRCDNPLTDRYVQEAKELLQLFGVPFVVSPQEAEAQCAKLESLHLCDGVITEDSDVWLFGASMVYKSLFQKDSFVKENQAEVINKRIGLTRSQLIALALMCGSDYTEGIEGIGVTIGMEILAEFPSTNGFDSLKRFVTWLEDMKKTKRKETIPTRKRLLKYNIPEGFPCAQIYDAYMNPMVDDSTETFSWGTPDLALLRQFTKHRFGWTQQKTDNCLLPVMRRLNERNIQSKITSHFSRAPNFNGSLGSPPSPSKRLHKVARRLVEAGRGDSSTSSKCVDLSALVEQEVSSKTARKRAPRKRKLDDPTTVIGKSQDCKTKKKAPTKSRRKAPNLPPVLTQSLNLSDQSDFESDSDIDNFIRNYNDTF